MKPADADPFHPLEVLRDAFLGDVAHRPVPPGARLGGVRRDPEPGGERIAARLRKRGHRDADRSDDGERQDVRAGEKGNDAFHVHRP